MTGRAARRRRRGPRSRPWRWIPLAAVVCGSLAFAPGADAKVFNVDTFNDTNDATLDGTCADGSGHCSLRAAIQEANYETANPGQDTVNVPAGTYELTAPNQLPITSNVVVDGAGSASNTTIKQGPPGNARIFDVTSTGSLDLRDATLTGSTLAADGGGIRSAGTLALERDVVSNNEAIGSNGGGIAIESGGGDTTILDSTIGSPDGGATPGNRAGSGAATPDGGGIYNGGGTLTIERSTIADNVLDSGDGVSAVPNGGGIYSDGPVVIEDSTISSNVAKATSATTGSVTGGAVYSNGSLTMRRTKVTGNHSQGTPGASGSYGGVASAASGLIEDSTMSGNDADNVGGNGIFHTGFAADTLTVRRSTVSGNAGGVEADGPLALENTTVDANGSGSGVAVGFDAQVTVRSSTISRQGSAGLVAYASGSGNAKLTVVGSILDGNAPDCDATPPATIVSGGGNVESGGGGCAAFLTDPSDKLNADSQLGPLQANAGPTETRAIPDSSPAHDAVPASACPPPSTDQRGIARPQGPACDSGAYEIAEAPGGGGSVGKPTLQLSGGKHQRAKKLKVKVGCGPVRCSVVLGGKAEVPHGKRKKTKFKLEQKSVDVGAGATVHARLTFKRKKKTLKKIKRLISHGGRKARKRAKVVVEATATNDGGTDSGRQKIKLKR